MKETPKLVIVVGDVNSTIACTLVAKKLLIDVAHIEAGLRSFDRRMPEEINRILTDQISDLLFTTEESAEINLKREGIESSKIFYVGNIMIDTLDLNRQEATELRYFEKLGLKEKAYALLTVHRPSNVDTYESLLEILEIITSAKEKIKIIFPIHPRTEKNIKNYNLMERLKNQNIILIEPIDYIKFLSLMIHSKVIITDSGGIQEEASYLNIPILTLRENTERPITIELGSNTLVGRDLKKFEFYLDKILNNSYKSSKRIDKWDGKAAERITNIIVDRYLS